MKTTEQRAAPGTVKARLIALRIGDTLPAPDRLERNKLYSIARRLGIRLRSENGTMTRTA